MFDLNFKQNVGRALALVLSFKHKSEQTAIVDFLYCGETKIQKENLGSFLSLADELQLRGLNEQQLEKGREGQEREISVF